MQLPDDQGVETVEAQPHVGCAGRHKNARGRAETEHALHRVRQAGVSLCAIEHPNQAPQFGSIETRLDFYPKPLREHHPKLSAPPHVRRLHRIPRHYTILNDLDGNNLVLGPRLPYALAPCIQRKHVQPMGLAKRFTSKTASFELQNQTLSLCPAQPTLHCNKPACVHSSTSAQATEDGKNVVARTRTNH